jgi:hypothetical protein
MTNPYARNIGDRIHGSILHRPGQRLALDWNWELSLKYELAGNTE